MQAIINKALAVLNRGGILLYPSDTVWGLACDATNEKAVKRIFEIKKRNLDKSVLIQVSSQKMLAEYVVIPFDNQKIITSFKPELVTLIYPYKSGLSKLAVAQDNTVAVRIAQDDFTKQLLEAFKKPIVSTSANRSGEAQAHYYKDISILLKNEVAYCVPLKLNECLAKNSKIIKVTADEVLILR